MLFIFTHAMLCITQYSVYAAAKCPFVCPSVCRDPVWCQNG